MNNKDIERNIVDVFEKIQPDQLQAILSDCKNNERRMIFMEEKRNNMKKMFNYKNYQLIH